MINLNVNKTLYPENNNNEINNLPNNSNNKINSHSNSPNNPLNDSFNKNINNELKNSKFGEPSNFNFIPNKISNESPLEGMGIKEDPLICTTRECVPTNNNSEVINTRDPQSVRNFVNSYTQFDMDRFDDRTTRSHCTAASIISASLLSNNLNSLVNHTLSQAILPGDIESLRNIRSRIENNTLRRADIEILQDILYNQLQDVDGRFVAGREDPGVRVSSINNYLNSSESGRNLLSSFSNSQMSFVGVNADSDPSNAEHCVLRIGNGSNIQYFDPYPRQGGQIITSQESIAIYNRSIVE